MSDRFLFDPRAYEVYGRARSPGRCFLISESDARRWEESDGRFSCKGGETTRERVGLEMMVREQISDSIYVRVLHVSGQYPLVSGKKG